MSLLSVEIPQIETDRLCLRAPQERDFEATAAFLAGPRAAFVGGPMDRFSAWRSFSGALGHWLLRGYGFWSVALRDTDAAVGRLGFLLNDGWDEPELGWQIFDGHEGKGYALEAARAALRIGPTKFGLDRVISYIDPANSRSLALARRLGATFEREGTVIGRPCHVYRHASHAGVM